MRTGLLTAKLRGLAIGALLLIASGCSLAPKMIYNRADSLVLREVEKYTQLDAAQRAMFDEGFAEIWHWHRTTQLPAYAALLEDIATRVVASDGGEGLTLEADFERLEGFGEAIAERITPLYRRIVVTLSDAQVEEIADQLAERLAEEAQDIEPDPQRRLERRIDDRIDFLEDWTGRLDAAQRARIEAWAQAYPSDPQAMLDYERARNARYLAHLQTRREADFVERDIAFDAQDQQENDPLLKPLIEERERLSKALHKDLLASLSARQRDHLADKLRGYAALARELAAQPR